MEFAEANKTCRLHLAYYGQYARGDWDKRTCYEYLTSLNSCVDAVNKVVHDKVSREEALQVRDLIEDTVGLSAQVSLSCRKY